MKTLRTTLLMVALLLPLAMRPTLAQTGTSPPQATGVLLRIDGDAVLERGETTSGVIVVNGDATVRGTADMVLVANGTARLDGARVGDLTVIDGTARLENGATVTGNVHLVGSELGRAPGTTVRGEVVRTAPAQLMSSLWLFGLVATVGVWIAILMGGMAAAGVAGPLMRDAGDTLVREPGRTLLSAAVLWIGVPALALGLVSTVVGIPLGIGLLLFVLPVLAFLGYLATGIRVGTAVLRSTGRKAQPARPYRAALLGTAILLFLGTVPGLGALATTLAATVGAGALVLTLWKREEGWRAPAAERREVPAPVAPEAETSVWAGVSGEDG